MIHPLHNIFWDRVNKKGPLILETKCWLWTGTQSTRGYGVYKKGGKGKVHMAHRLSWEVTRGPIGDKWVLHKCDNTTCVNPGHLFLGTHDDNVRDKVSKMRQVYGERINTAKLTEETVIEIRRRAALGEIHAKLAREFGVAQVTVSRAVRGESWKHLLPRKSK